MINGSRFGASFIILLTGFVFYLRGVRGKGVTLSVAVVSVVILLLFLRRYRDALMALNGFFTANRRRFSLFVGILALVPLTLLLP